MTEKRNYRHNITLLCMKKLMLLLFLCFICGQSVRAQVWTYTEQEGFFKYVKPRTNLLYWGTLTPNIGADFYVSPRVTFGGNFGYRPWPLSDDADKKWRHLLAAAELRLWNDSTFKHESTFWAIDAIYSHFNVSGVKFPFGMYQSVRDNRLQGDMVALALSFGYNIRLNSLLRMEFEGGMGVGFAWADKYACGHCGTYLGKDNKPFLMPKLAVNIVLDPRKKQRIEPVIIIPEPIDTVVPEPVEEPKPVVKELVLTSVAEKLVTSHPILKDFKDYRPYDRTRVMRKEKDMLYVHFPLDKIELRRDFMDNDTILDEIVSVTRQIMADDRSRVRLIQIVGLASVEGPVKHNEWLAKGRAEALRDYVLKAVPETTTDIFEVNGGGEAWSEFRDQINDLLTDSTLMAKHKELTRKDLLELLRIANEEPNLNVRERKLKQLRGGRPYRYLLRTMLAEQRNSGYVQIYFERVPDVKAETINRGAALLNQQDYEGARQILETVKDDPRSWNAYGVSLYMTGQHEEAIEYFRRSAEQGNDEAKENLKRLAEHGGS